MKDDDMKSIDNVTNFIIDTNCYILAQEALKYDEKIETFTPETRSAIYYAGFADGMREAIKIISRF